LPVNAVRLYVHAHKLRHTSATWLAGSGANAFEIQKQLGHATLDISLRYVHLNEANLRETIERHSPVEGMTRRSRQQGR
jgi:integrase/recombinase XerD